MELKSLLLISAAVSTNRVEAWGILPPPPPMPPENRPAIVRQLPSTHAASLNRVAALRSYGLRRIEPNLSTLAEPSKTTSSSTLVPIPMQQHQTRSKLVLNPGHLYSSEGPQADDVVQGQAGDCYLLALLAALAEHRPEIITDAIRPTDASETDYLIDYFVPTKYGSDHSPTAKKSLRIFDTSYLSKDNRPLYAGDSVKDRGDGQVNSIALTQPSWVKLFENWFAKASEEHQLLAKRPGFNGIGYGGWATIPYQMLTGEEMEKLQPNTLEQFRDVIDRVDNGDILVLVSGPETFSEYYIPSSHSFAVMRHDGDKITLYNPMGREVCLDAELLFKCTHTIFAGRSEGDNG